MLLRDDDHSNSIRGSRFRRQVGVLAAAGVHLSIISLLLFARNPASADESPTKCGCDDTEAKPAIVTVPKLPEPDETPPLPKVEQPPDTKKPVEYAAAPKDDRTDKPEVRETSLEPPAPNPVTADPVRLAKYLQPGTARSIGVVAPGYEVIGVDATTIDRLIASGSAKLVVAKKKPDNQYNDADFYQVAWTPSGPRAFYQLFGGWPEELKFSKRVVTNLDPGLLALVGKAAEAHLGVPATRLFVAVILQRAADERILQDQRALCTTLRLDCEKVVKTTGAFRWSSAGNIEGLAIEEVRFSDGESAAVRELAEAASLLAATGKPVRPE